MAEGAVSNELVSGPNSLLAGNWQGIFVDFQDSGRFERKLSTQIQTLT
jgi:hypothetical protein